MILSLAQLLLATVALSRPQSPPSADFTGVDRFWAVAEALTHGAEPSSDEWRHLFDAPAYRTLQKDARLQRLMRLAFLPASQIQRDSVLATDSYDAAQLRHLRRILDHREALQRFRDSLATIDVLGQATPLAAAYLPPGETARRPPPPLAFGLFEPAAYGGRNGITVDLLFALERGPQLIPLLAHEVHHFHAGFVSRLHLPARSAPEFRLVQYLRNLADEGTADRINLVFPVTPPALPPDVVGSYNVAYDHAVASLRSVDSLLASAGSDSAHARRAGDGLVATLVYAGHPVGAYMAERIERRLGRDGLIAAVGNPFEFLRCYARADSLASGTNPFSPASRAYLAALEERFVGPPPQ